jgi:hypothetical protein
MRSYAPPPLASLPPATYDSAAQPTPWNDPPAAPPAIDPSPSPALVEAIAEVRQRLGSPIDASFGPGPIEPYPAQSEKTAPPLTFTSAGEPADSVVADDSEPKISAPDESPRAAPVAPLSKAEKIAALLDALHTASQHLYELNLSLEADEEYARADQIRNLAREIREEISKIGREHLPAPAPPVAATVQAASFNPAEPDQPIAPPAPLPYSVDESAAPLQAPEPARPAEPAILVPDTRS